MDLATYLDRLRGGDKTWHNKIELPGTLTTFFDNLWNQTEQAGLERGCYLHYNPATQQFTHGGVVSGFTDHMDIPRSDDPMNFGDVHAHPCAPIGHAGGYSAHSADDLKHFGDFADRDYFIQFVAAGPRIYAMVYVKGVSVWNNEVVKFLDEGKATIERANRALLWGNVDDQTAEDLFTEEKLKYEDVDKFDAHILGLKQKVKDYGKRVEKHSTDFCQEFATRWDYHFLRWARTEHDCVIL